MANSIKKKIVGLTGGIACGKSSALAIFEDLGWATISTDELVSKILESNLSVQKKIIEKWGKEVGSKSSGLKKARIAEIIFSNEGDKKWLEELIHPLVRNAWMHEVEQAKAEKVIVEIPLLFEKNLQDLFDVTICIGCSREIQMKRLHDRGLTKAQSNARIRSQLSICNKMQHSDIVLLGENSILFLKQQICIFDASINANHRSITTNAPKKKNYRGS